MNTFGSFKVRSLIALWLNIQGYPGMGGSTRVEAKAKGEQTTRAIYNMTMSAKMGKQRRRNAPNAKPKEDKKQASARRKRHRDEATRVLKEELKKEELESAPAAE